MLDNDQRRYQFSEVIQICTHAVAENRRLGDPTFRRLLDFDGDVQEVRGSHTGFYKRTVGKEGCSSQEECWTLKVQTRMCRNFPFTKRRDGGGAQMGQ